MTSRVHRWRPAPLTSHLKKKTLWTVRNRVANRCNWKPIGGTLYRVLYGHCRVNIIAHYGKIHSNGSPSPRHWNVSFLYARVLLRPPRIAIRSSALRPFPVRVFYSSFSFTTRSRCGVMKQRFYTPTLLRLLENPLCFFFILKISRKMVFTTLSKSRCIRKG